MTLEKYIYNNLGDENQGLYVELGSIFRKTDLGQIGVKLPFSVISGQNIRVSELILFLIFYYYPWKKHSKIYILDPTCGIFNHQFNHQFWRSRKYEKYNIVYVATDINPIATKNNKDFASLAVVCDVFKLPFKEKSFHIIIYDPPYLTQCREDERGEDYAIAHDHSIGEIQKYYSREVFKEFHRVLKDNGILIVKGSDFYYPTTCDENCILFFHRILKEENFKEYFYIKALHIYRYFHSIIPLYRYRLRRKQRPLFVHTYYVIFKKRKT